MDIGFFIARRLAMSGNKSFTKIIVNIAILSMALSIAIMLLSSAIITGFKREINSKIFGFWGHIHVADAGIQRNFELRPISISDSYFEQIKEIKYIEFQNEIPPNAFKKDITYQTTRTKGGISSVQPYIIMPCLVETKKEMIAGLFKGVKEDYDWARMKRFLKYGSGIDPADTSYQIVISNNIADKLNLKIGKKLLVTFIKEQAKLKRALIVKGIYNTGIEEYDEKIIIGNASLIQSILEWQQDQYSGIEIFVDDYKEMEVLNEYIYTSILPTNLYSETIKEKFPSIFEWLNFQDINEKIILLLMCLVAVINLVTILLILILERTRMVGVLKSLGASNWAIRKVFVYHASYIFLVGLLLGNILGLGLAFLQKITGFIKLDEQNYYIDVAPIYFDWYAIIIINVGAFMVCFLTLFLPSLLITKITPVKALRFD